MSELAAPPAAAWRSPERQRADPAGNRSPHAERPTEATRAKSGEPPLAGPPVGSHFSPWLFSPAGAEACRHFADLLDYPRPAVLAALCPPAAPGGERGWVAGVRSQSPTAAGLLETFLRAASHASLGDLEELYAQTFDLQPQCTLHLGHRMFGDDWKRSALLIELQTMYQRYGVSIGGELPDHLCWVLRLLSAAGAATDGCGGLATPAPTDGSEAMSEVQELATSILRPGVRGLERQLATDNPYTGLLRALYLLLADADGEAGDEDGVDQTLRTEETRP